MIAHLDELAAAGVNAIKIEGRNKKAFYVASVVGAYRSVLDGGDISDAEEELLAVSHRPYGTGFYFGEAQQASDFEGYEQQTLHVADVLDCREVDVVDDGADDIGDGAAGAGDSAGGGAAGAVGNAGDDAGDRADRAADNGAGDAGDGMANGGAGDEDRQDDQGQCRVLTVRCRNRFEEGDELEILRPREVPLCVVVHDLVWLKQSDAADDMRIPKPVEVANRASELYSFVAQGLSMPVVEGSFLRVREYRRSTGGK